jgi:hypothetical protein
VIAVIIDSPEAENAARSLSERLQAKGNDTVLLDSGSYIAGKICADKTIVIGHDLLAEMKLRSIPALGYDIYGMKYGFKGDVCVLSAQRNLNFKEQTDFLIYADNRLRYYQSCGIKTEKYISPNTREDDIGRATREFMSEMKEWYCDGDNSASGIAIKTGLTVAFSPLIALVGVGGLLAAACQSGSAAIDRYEILKMQYQLLSLEFETQDSQHFLKQPKKQMKTANASVKPRAEYIKPKSHIMPGMPAFDELDRLVGLENVKRTVKEIVIFLRKRGKNAVPCLHMVFRGNPGTAKTTVARMIARIFYESGITEKNLLVETGRAGLIGGYVGQTALKTEKQINKSLGGVLFIDEAYSLFTGDNRDYGNEAVATLVKAMEDKRDKFICIMAGYTDEINSMIDMNPGLRDRVQFYRVSVNLRNREKFCQAFLSVVMSSSSPKEKSRCQCSLFSTAQCPLIASAQISMSLTLPMKRRRSLVTSPEEVSVIVFS